MRSRRLLVVLGGLFLSIPACGGGGSGHSSGGGVVATDSAPPTVAVTFPSADSATDSSTIDVRGTASDATGVESVSVNGVPATTTDGFATWEAVVPVTPATTALVVAAQDVVGNSDSSAAVVSIVVSPPMVGAGGDVAFDAANRKAYLLDPTRPGLFELDLATRLTRIVSDPATGAGPSLDGARAVAIDAANSRALVVTSTNSLVIAIDLASGDRSVVSSDTLGAGPLPTTVVDAAFDVARTRLVVLDASSASIVAVDMATGDRAPISGGAIGGGPAFQRPTALLVDAALDRMVVADTGLDALLTVDPATGDRAILSDSSKSGPGLLDPTSLAGPMPLSGEYLVLDVGVAKLIAVDATTGDRRHVSGPNDSGPSLATFDQIAFDGDRHVVAVDADSEVVLVVDVDDGSRVPLAPPLRVGSGFPIVALDDVVDDSTNGTAFVADGSWLVSVKLDGGDRALLDLAPANGPPSGTRITTIDFDSSKRLVYLFEEASGDLLAVDVNNGRTTVVAGPSRGRGPLLEGTRAIALDPTRNRILANVESGQPAALASVVAVDLATGDRTVLVRDDGPQGFVSIADLAFDVSHGRVLAYGSAHGVVAVWAIDAASGAMTPLSMPRFAGVGPDLPAGGRIAVDATHVYVTGVVAVDGASDAEVALVDLETGDRSILTSTRTDTTPRGPALVDPVGVAIDRDRGVALVGDDSLHALFSVDLTTGQRTIVSR